MQIRCGHCHKPFALSKDAVIASLDAIEADGLSHYNAYCPHCRRANRISRQELQRSAPEWHPKDQAEQTGQSEEAELPTSE
jgi:phage FluMu protein Com